MMNKLHIQPWRITAQGAITEFTQSIFSVGNGFLGLRGFSLQQPKGLLHDHAMFRAGLYEYIKPGITDLVQLPDVLGLRLTGHKEANIHHELDLRTGVYTQRWQDSHVQVTAQRMASMADPQLICVRLTLTAQRGCDVQIESAVDDQVANLPIHDDQMVTDKEAVPLLETVSRQADELVMQTVHSHRRVRFLITLTGRMQAHLEAGESLTVEKRVRVLVDEELPREEAADPGRRTRTHGPHCGGTAISSWMAMSAYREAFATTSSSCCAPMPPGTRGYLSAPGASPTGGTKATPSGIRTSFCFPSSAGSGPRRRRRWRASA